MIATFDPGDIVENLDTLYLEDGSRWGAGNHFTVESDDSEQGLDEISYRLLDEDDDPTEYVPGNKLKLIYTAEQAAAFKAARYELEFTLLNGDTITSYETVNPEDLESFKVALGRDDQVLSVPVASIAAHGLPGESIFIPARAVASLRMTYVPGSAA